MKRGCLFPLRTNAAFYGRAGTLSLEQRIKQAALIFDELIFEDGMYVANAGPEGSFSVWSPITRKTLPDQRKLRQTGGSFQIFAGGQVMVSSTTERHFTAEYHSVVDSIVDAMGGNAAPAWVRLVTFQADQAMKDHVTGLTKQDARSPGLWRRKGSHRLRDRVLANLNYDLMLSAWIGWPISCDDYFAPMVKRKRPAVPKVGLFAFQTLAEVFVPGFASLTWPQLAELRDAPAVARLRSHLREIEAEALDGFVGTECGARNAVLRRAFVDLAKEWTAPSGLDTAGRVSINLLLGTMGPVGSFTSALFQVGDHISNANVKGSSWVAAFLRMRQLTGG